MTYRAFYSAVSGMSANNLSIDVIGNNIANVSTTAFKSSRAAFQDSIMQTIATGRGAATDGTIGGTNPKQVGLGTQVASIDSIFTQGALIRTDRLTDLAIQGDGFFIVSDGTQTYYTRDGNFTFDSSGNMVNSDGNIVQGRIAVNGAISDTVGNLAIEINQNTAPAATTEIDIVGNLNNGAAAGSTSDAVTRSIQVYDEAGNARIATFQFIKAGDTTWTMTLQSVDGATPDSGGDTATLTFNDDGSFASITYENGSNFVVGSLDGGQADIVFTVNAGTAGDYDGATHVGGSSTMAVTGQDGYASGSIVTFSIDESGTIIGNLDNGQRVTLGQIALATFDNNQGLSRVGRNLYQPGSNSGIANVGVAGDGRFGAISQGALENSNVDLAREFTNLIVAQRAFQSNARMISVADSILQEVVNLSR